MIDEIPACLAFEPRPDQPERFDEQESFYHDRLRGTAWLIGGNGSGTTETALAKVAKFVLFDQPPPRPDTPFWILAPDLTTACELWAEKLHGHQHIPSTEVDWERVSWWKPNNNHPFRVPLKPWPGRPKQNWSLEFKSVGQGRHRLESRSIGGFMFTEQFPLGIMTEVKRGCREYNFPGSQIAEYTPIDPNISPEIDEMLENGPSPENPAPGARYLPASDRVYRCNTECAVEAGHVSSDWFEDFFGLVSDEMRETRMTGALASFEGQIYRGFNPAIHLVGDAECFLDGVPGMFPKAVHHRRSIDWGSGQDNAFSCHWAYRNSRGQFYVYDEYYSTRQIAPDGSSWTTVDHLKEVCDLWPWPENSQWYGVTYADPASASDIKIASKLSQYTDGRYPNLRLQGAANDVLAGIEHVQWCLKPTVNVSVPRGNQVVAERQPRLFIHRERCPNLARQMRSYRWRKSASTGLNPQDARREPLKREDHAVDDLRYLLYSEAIQSGMTPDSWKRTTDVGRRGVGYGRRRAA